MKDDVTKFKIQHASPEHGVPRLLTYEGVAVSLGISARQAGCYVSEGHLKAIDWAIVSGPSGSRILTSSSKEQRSEVRSKRQADEVSTGRLPPICPGLYTGLGPLQKLTRRRRDTCLEGNGA